MPRRAVLAGLLSLPMCAASCAASVASTLANAAHAHSAAQSQPDSRHSIFAWWEIIQHGSRAELLSLLSPVWWAEYIAREFEAEPAHVLVEILCILTIVYLLALRKPQPMQQERLSKKVHSCIRRQACARARRETSPLVRREAQR